MPPPEARICVGAGMPGCDHQVQPVPQPEGDAFQHGPRQVPLGRASASARRRRRAPAGRGAGSARRRDRAGTAGRRCRPARSRPPPRDRRTRPPGLPRRGTSAGCRPPTASPTSCASDPGTAWQNAWTRPPGSTTGADVAAKTTPGRAERQATSRPSRPHRSRRRSPPDRRRPRPPAFPRGGPSPRPRPRSPRPVTCGPSSDRGSHAASIPSASVISVGPVAGREVEEDRPRPVGLVHGVFAGEPQANVVLRQQHVRDPRPDLGLVVGGPRAASGP